MGNPFDDMLAELDGELAKSGGGAVKFMKDGDCTIKLVSDVGPDGKYSDLFRRYESLFKDGSTVVNFLVQCIILKAEADGMANKDVVVYLRLPNTGIKLIRKAISDDPEVLDHSGPVIVVGRSKSKPTTYSANVKTRITFNDEAATRPEMTIDEAVADQIDRSAKNVTAAAARAKPASPVIEGDEDLFKEEGE